MQLKKLLKRRCIYLFTALMVLDAILAVIIIASVLMQSGKSSGLAGIGGGSDGLFSGKAKTEESVFARITMISGSLFGIVTLFLAKLSM